MRCAVAPTASDLVVDAVRAGGGTVVGLADAPDALVWMAPSDADGLGDALEQAPSVSWVQLPFAGVEAFDGVLDPALTWTCAKGAYAEPVAEHALALALAGLRGLPDRVRATAWGEQGAATLYDARVVVLGAGGITTDLAGPAVAVPGGGHRRTARRGYAPAGSRPYGRDGRVGQRPARRRCWGRRRPAGRSPWLRVPTP